MTTQSLGWVGMEEKVSDDDEGNFFICFSFSFPGINCQFRLSSSGLPVVGDSSSGVSA